ncbi:hypothetical protein ACQEWB_07275 [Streptomyces sp. CA-249302]|uniref:hypothetical protein n=1 Tax=Streptomyces sp. CA-249302 TaxID=3240058 RepID=UPI003D92D00F
MHRTTTTATLLVTVAVSALSGCVTVQRPPVPGPPPAAPSQPSAPRPDGQSEPQIVQAPAREALEMIGPSRSAKPTKPERHGAATSAPAPAEPPTAPRAHPHPHPHPRQPHPKPRHQQQPDTQIPDVTKSVPKSQSDVCALGKKYGGWQADSPQSVICKQAYGR